jgi:V8-like Glu-specific endopeptidase
MFPQPLDKTQFPYVGMIRSFFPNRGGNADGGTGTLIHPQVILTAGHVVYDAAGGGYPTRADIELGDTQRIHVSSTVFRTTQAWQDTDSLTRNPISAYDLGAILLSEPIPTSQVPIVPFAANSGTSFGGLPINVVGYPVQSDIYGTLYGAAAFPTAPYPQLDGFRLFFPIDILGGMSGGPAYTRDASGQILLRGVVTSMYNGSGSALRIYEGLAALIRSWIREVGG